MNKTIISTQKTTEKLSFKVQIKQESGVYVASVPELNISVRAGTEADARAQATEALKQFFEDAKRNGTLMSTLAELQAKTKANP
ncbi:MAG: type II toxin-antitoxin system HicB family antitoxin [Terriglobia bacterium]